MNSFTITSEIKGTEKYLTIQCEQEKLVNDYLVKMLEYNSILGIFPLKSQKMNGKTILNYPVGNRYLIRDLIISNQIGVKETKILYKRLVDSMESMAEYFLNANQCIYEVEYLYVDAMLNPYLLYVPIEGDRMQEMSKIWKNFFQDLLALISDGKQDAYYDKLMRFLIRTNDNLKEFKNFLAEEDSVSNVEILSVQEQMQQEKPAENIPVIESPLKKEHDIQKEKISSAQNILIPGKVMVSTFWWFRIFSIRLFIMK